MKTQKIKIIDFLRDDINLWIPFYQLNFNWTNPQFEFLYEDLLALADRDSHYFGPIVFLKKEKTKLQGQSLSRRRFECYEIIDGQQRITTILIILLLLLSKKMTPEGIKTEIRNTIFWNSTDPTSKKLSLHTAEEEDFEFICKNLSVSDVKSTSMKNCWWTFNQHINNQLEKNPAFIEPFYSWIKKLDVVLIETEEEEDSRIIFERINTTGLILSNYDKLKNAIYLRFDRDQQESINPRFLYIEGMLGITSDSRKADDF